MNCCWFISTVQPESKPEVSAPKDVASPASPPASVCPISAAKPARTNTSSPSAQASAAPALSTQVRPRAGNGNDKGAFSGMCSPLLLCLGRAGGWLCCINLALLLAPKGAPQAQLRRSLPEAPEGATSSPRPTSAGAPHQHRPPCQKRRQRYGGEGSGEGSSREA